MESLNLDQQVKDAWGKAAEFSELELLADVADISRKNEGERRHPFLRARSSSTLGKDAYAKALRANILASGDTCSRAVFIGAVLAAASGEVPQDWVDKVDKGTMDQIDALANKIAELVGAE